MNNVSYAIVYNGGAYGSFIAWLLRWATDENFSSTRPWGLKGNSHCWNFLQIGKIENIFSLSKDDKKKGVQIHPIGKAEENLYDNVNIICSQFDRVIFSYSSYDDIVWCINNKHEKIYPEGWINANITHFADAFSNWAVGRELEIFELREWLSFFMHDEHIVEVRLNDIPTLNFDNMIKITMSDLKNSFKDVLFNLSNFLDKKIIRSEEEIEQIYKEWFSLQIHHNKDSLTKKYTNAIINNVELQMDNLTLVDTAEIQRLLREHGYEIACYKLNKWPNSTLDISKLLYRKEN